MQHFLKLIHVDVWHKTTQYCKEIILQLKINKKFKKMQQLEGWFSNPFSALLCTSWGPGYSSLFWTASPRFLCPLASKWVWPWVRVFLTYPFLALVSHLWPWLWPSVDWNFCHVPPSPCLHLSLCPSVILFLPLPFQIEMALHYC